jgi:hypothetical protein
LGKFWQFWAEFAALALADNMPKDHLKSITFGEGFEKMTRQVA